MSSYFLFAILLLGFVITFQIAKASEYVGILKGEKKNNESNNRINGFLMIVFLVLGLIGVYWCNELFRGKILGKAASDHGQKIDQMLYITIAITGVVFFITQILLFWFSFKYQYSEKRKGYYFPHNNKLEVIWTVVPAIALTVLVGFGLMYWFQITGEAPKNALQVEITGKQFSWIFRYPGKDNVFGNKYYKNISDAENNSLGLLWDDPRTHDDIVVNSTMYAVVNQPSETDHQFPRCDSRCGPGPFQNENGCSARNPHYDVVYTVIYDRRNEEINRKSRILIMKFPATRCAAVDIIP